ncbi:MAG TPA: hypothetical protein VJ249_08570 [Candidatus Bathyarchaeia archaeon]|nr:hypothetical protein [Candidatus Bathyarchaeia archaeon]
MEISDRKQLVDELKEQWKTLWRNRFDDRVRAEGIADKDYSMLLIERGTVIIATRKFKLLDLQDILEQHRNAVGSEWIPPNPSVGGWGKFVRTVLDPKNPKQRRRQAPSKTEHAYQRQLKKGGRGWLHIKA